MLRWSSYLRSLGDVQSFDYSYTREGRRRPDPLPALIAAHNSALAQARSSGNYGRVFLIGKSMGGRIACHVALQEPVHGVICLGYPLCGGGDRNKLRDKVLLELQEPVLFVQGTRDPLCPLDLLASVRAQMKAPNYLHVVEGGDHSLHLRKRDVSARRTSQDEVERRILENIRGFTDRAG